MKNIDWPPQEIKALAQTSGKPLEVQCAQAFLASRWIARLGSYFEDGDVLRELDVLAEKEQVIPDLSGLRVRVRALISCKAFRPDQSPLTYSVSNSCVPSPRPHLLTEHRAIRPRANKGNAYGPLPDVEENAAARLLELAGLTAARPIVAFDLIERSVEAAKHNKPEQIEITRSPQGDRQLFRGLDSAIKAAMFWQRHDRGDEHWHATLNVPVCVLSVPFWDVCIDGGQVADPEILKCGYQVNSYPRRPVNPDMMLLLWDVGDVFALVHALGYLLDWFRLEMRSGYFFPMWAPNPPY
jgi:hypothetical protein